MSSVAANRRGILAMLMAVTLFTGNDTLLKIAAAELPPGQIMAVRGVIASLMAAGLVLAFGQRQQLRALASPIVLGRAGLEAAVAFLFITSVSRLPLANITAILQATPLILTLLAVVLGMEQVGWRRWSAIGLGFAGVLLIVRPSASGFNAYAFLAVVAAALIAARDLATRLIGGHVPPIVVTLSATAAVTLTGFVLAIGEDWRPLTWREVTILGSAALLVTLGNLGIVRAFQVGEMSVVSPFRYAAVATALAAGFWTFGELPDRLSCAGIALIALSGLYTLHREQVRQRQLWHHSGTGSRAGEPS